MNTSSFLACNIPLSTAHLFPFIVRLHSFEPRYEQSITISTIFVYTLLEPHIVHMHILSDFLLLSDMDTHGYDTAAFNLLIFLFSLYFLVGNAPHV